MQGLLLFCLLIMTTAPIVLFVYNRPIHTERVLASLQKNSLVSDAELFVYSDAPGKTTDDPLVRQVRKTIHSITGFRRVQIIEQEHHRGLANSVISGVSDVIQRYGKVIVIEDDLFLSPNFLAFMNAMLDFYKLFSEVYSISGFSYPAGAIQIPEDYPYDVYLSYRSLSWGWATWLDRWQTVDWKVTDFYGFVRARKSQILFNRGGEDLSDMLKLQMVGKIDSWAIRWCYAHFQHNAFCICPNRSFVKNFGFDGSGTHCGLSKSAFPRPALDDDWMPSRLLDRILVNPEIINSFYKIHKRSLATRVKTRIRLSRSMGMLKAYLSSVLLSGTGEQP
jgi:hypothetical protein